MEESKCRSEERNIKIVLGYDGSDFSGWQIQKGQRTVQGEIESSLERMHGHPVRISSAGRTDSGVHARGQVVNFPSDIARLDPPIFFKALNSFLPRDIRASSSCVAEPDFHARYSALARMYRYYMVPVELQRPEQRRFSMALRGRRPDIRHLNSLCPALLGERDFSSFAASGDICRTKVRRVHSVSFYAKGELLVFQICANAFLWRMVRNILGTLLEIEADGEGPDELARILSERRRVAAGAAAPPHGLFLEKVYYDENEVPC